MTYWLWNIFDPAVTQTADGRWRPKVPLIWRLFGRGRQED